MGRQQQHEDFSTAVDLENDCCEVYISNESPVNCDIINIFRLSFPKSERLREFVLQISFEESNFTEIC